MTQEDRDKVEQRVNETLRGAAPLRVCESMTAALAAFETQCRADGAVKSSPDAVRRLERFETYQRSLSSATASGLLHPGGWFREAAGRLHVKGGAQDIANAIRHHVAPDGAGRVFIDADYSNAHMRIAAVRSNDTALLAMFEAGKDCYDALGVAVLPAAPDRAAVRKAMKRSALSLINGSGAGRIAEYLKGLSSDSVKDARALINHWNETYPDLAAYIGDRLEAIEAAGDSFELETLTGRVVHIDHGGNNLTALSAHWSVVEAEAMDLALSRLPEAIGKHAGRLVLPMYDGLLLDAPRSKARAVAAAVADLMARAMTKAGVPGVTVKVEARDRWAGPSIDLEQDGPDVQQAKDFTEPDDLARWHVKAVLDAMLDPNRPKPAPIAPLPGGYGADRSRESRNDAELLADPFPDAGWPDLTRLIEGWRPDTVAVLVGHTGRGKSSIAVQSAEAAAKAGAPVLYASLEMSAEELACRLLSLRGRPGAAWVGVKRRQYSPEAIRRAADRLIAECPHLYLWAPDSRGRNVETLSRMAAAVSAAGGGGAPLVVLDYVQRCAPAEAEDRRMAVSDLSGRLRDLSRPGSLNPEWPGAAVLALSSTGRNNYKTFDNTAALRMGADLEGSGKESGELEYDAPILLCMTSDLPGEGESDPYEGRMALVRVVKNREGMPGTAWLRFEAARGRFTHTTAPPLPEKPEKGPAGPNEYQRAVSLKAADDKKSKAVLAADGARDKALLAAGDDQAKRAKAHAAHALAVGHACKLHALEQEQAHERQGLRSTSKQETKANRSEGRF